MNDFIDDRMHPYELDTTVVYYRPSSLVNVMRNLLKLNKQT